MTLFLAPLLAIAVLIGVAVLLAAQKGRQAHLVGTLVEPDTVRSSAPAVLFFTGENCNVCHTAQKPALAQVAESFANDVEIQEIDVAQRPELARAYRVMTLPTTVVLAAGGRVSHINVGFATAETLRAQLRALGAPVAA